MLTLALLQRDFYSMRLDRLELESITDLEVSNKLADLEWSRSVLDRCSLMVRRDLFQLSIPPSDETCFNGWQYSERTNKQLLRLDWIFLFHELRAWTEDTQRQLDTKMTDIRIRDSKRAYQNYDRAEKERKSVDKLTKLGQFLLLFFTPVGLAYGLLSMAGDFAPGNDKFWMFFAIAIPLVASTILAFCLCLKYPRRDEGTDEEA